MEKRECDKEMIREAIARAIRRLDLTEEEMVAVMNEIMSGEASSAQIGAFLTALRMKGETIPEITGAARVMRSKATRIKAGHECVVDTCGTGGDEAGTFNISTAAAIVAAGAGVVVAKHGNRSVSSRSGSAEVLKALGVNVEAKVERVEECIREVGIGFLFAPLLHGAMKYGAPVRREIGVRTIFNILGPLTNPASARHQVLGVYDDALTDIMAKVLSNLGSRHAFVVRGEDGLDEITLTTETKVTELRGGSVKTYHIKPEDYGFERCGPDDLKGGEPSDNAEIITAVLKGEKGPKMDVVILNAAAAIVASGRVETIAEGVVLAGGAVDQGAAMEKLKRLIEVTNR